MAFDYKDYIDNNPLLNENEESNRAEKLAKEYDEVLSAFITYVNGEWGAGLDHDDILGFFKWSEDGDYDFQK